MASTNDNLFTSFCESLAVVRIKFVIGGRSAHLRVGLAGQRVQSLHLVDSPLERAAHQGQQRKLFIEWLARFEAATPSEQWERLALQGTAFQEKVWRHLLELGWGRRISYGALAHGIGSSKAVRAVATAVAANPIALLVPCHRIIRANGSLGGFRWGRAFKQALLESEQHYTSWSALLSQDSRT